MATRQPRKAAGGSSRLGVRARSSLSALFGRGRLPAVAIALLAMVGLGLSLAWRQFAPAIAARDEYRLSADCIRVSLPPDWLVTDVRDEVVRDGSLDAGLSILDDDLVKRLIDAFEIHPWVQSVDRVTKKLPAGVDVAVTYRKPIAAVVVELRDRKTLSPVDADGVRLPAKDIRPMAVQVLPRIAGALGQPPIGQPWRDERVRGGCRLAQFLAAEWDALGLVDILPSERSEIYNKEPYFDYDLVTRGGTRIWWGAAPGAGPPQESPPEDKLERLRRFVAKHGPLTDTNSPKTIDVRHGLDFEARDARKGVDGDRQEAVR